MLWLACSSLHSLPGPAKAWPLQHITNRSRVTTLKPFLLHLTPTPARRLDPPANYFRLRLVCTLLEVCGQYFTRGPARRKLDRFLPYLQRYLLAKPPLPLDVEFDVQVGGWG